MGGARRRGEAWTFDPTDVGIPTATLADLKGGDVASCRGVADAVLDGTAGPARDVVLLGAAAALYAADAVPDLPAGLARAAGAVDTGAASDLRDRWVARSRGAGAVGRLGRPGHHVCVSVAHTIGAEGLWFRLPLLLSR